MSNVSSNREYRLKLFKEKIYNSTIKAVNSFEANSVKKGDKQLNNSELSIIDKNLNNNIKCPHCKTKEVIKYGVYSGKQRYKCKNNMCERTFTEEYESPFRHSKKFRENYEKYKVLFEEGLSIRACAAKLNITIVTAFFWRHRFLYNLKQVNYIDKLCNYAELTRIVIIENFKGDRKSKGKDKGKISIVNGMNKAIDIISIVAARNHLGITQLKENIEPRIDKKAVAVAFLDGRLQAFSDKHNRKNKITIRKIEVVPIDKMYSLKVKRWLIKFRGVATKYIDHYLSWKAYEYKNNIEIEVNDSNNCNYNRDTKHNYIDKEYEKLRTVIDSDIKMSTYISWGSIKEKVLLV